MVKAITKTTHYEFTPEEKEIVEITQKIVQNRCMKSRVEGEPVNKTGLADLFTPEEKEELSKFLNL